MLLNIIMLVSLVFLEKLLYGICFIRIKEPLGDNWNKLVPIRMPTVSSQIRLSIIANMLKLNKLFSPKGVRFRQVLLYAFKQIFQVCVSGLNKIAMIFLSRYEQFWIQQTVARNWFLQILIDNIFAMIDRRICEETVGIRMGTNLFQLSPRGSFIRITGVWFTQIPITYTFSIWDYNVCLAYACLRFTQGSA
jgi:hypothetical protein